MAKKKSVKKGLMVQAKVIDIYRHDEGMGVSLNDGKRQQSFVIQFDVTDEELDIGETVTVTMVRSEA
jgi:hypothetical protein